MSRRRRLVIGFVPVLALALVLAAAPTSADPIDPCDGTTTPQPDWCLEWSGSSEDEPAEGDEEATGASTGGEDEEESCGWVRVPPESAPERGAVLVILTNGWPPEGLDVVWYGWCSAEPTTAAGGGEAAVGFLGPYRWEPAEDELAPSDVAAEAYEAIQDRMPDPMVATSPPEGVDAVVGVPVFVTVENWEDELVEVRGLGGDTVTVTATAELVFDPGEPGAEASTCSGPGRPYEPSGGDLWVQASAEEACTHAYRQRTGAHGRRDEWPSSVTVRWSIEWRATSGERGAFPTATRSVAIPRSVSEVQAVVVSEGGR